MSLRVLLLALGLAGAGGCGSPTSPVEAPPPQPGPSAPPSTEPEVQPAVEPPAAPPASEPNVASGTNSEPGSSPAKPPGNTVMETRTTEVIQKVVLDNRQNIRDCYEVARLKDPTLRGTLTLEFTLTPEGGVKTAALNKKRSTLVLPSLVSCAVNALQQVHFPPSSRGFESTVNYPFDFRP